MAASRTRASSSRTPPVDRRNLYRRLHVQPDAPIEVIRAAYRALIALHHPDAGGDHEQATRLNEAWQVLGDPARRTAYDAKRAARVDAMKARQSGRVTSAHEPDAGTTWKTGRRQASSPTAADDAAPGACPFCEARVDTGLIRCARCQAPLTRVKPLGVGTDATDRDGERRRLPRVSRADWSLLYPDWRSDPIDVRLRNLSLGGASFYTGVPLVPGQRVRVSGAPFDAVLDVRTCQRLDNVFVVHGHFVTASFAAKAGNFVHTTA